MPPDEGLGSAKIPIRPDLEGLEPELEKARKKIEGSLGNVFSKLGGTLAKAGKAAVIGGLGAVAAGVGAIGTASLASAMAFDEAFDNIQTKTGATGEVLEGLKADATAVFKSLPVDIEQAAEVVGTLNQRLGMTGDSAQELAKRLLMLGTDDTARSTELYTRVIGDWGVKNEDAAATLDTLYKTSQITGIGVDDLMAKVVQFGSPLRLMGFSLEESAAMFGKWEKEGVNAELVMGSLRIAAGQFAKAGVPLQQGLKDTISEIQNMDDASAALSLGMEVFGARAGPDMVAAIREGRFELGDLIEAMGDSENAILDTAEATMDFPEKFKMMKNGVQTSLKPIGDVIMGSLGGVIEKIAPLVENTLLPLLEEKVVPAVQTLGTALEQVMGGDLAGGLATIFGEETVGKVQELAASIGDFIDRLGGLDVVLNTVAVVVGGILVVAFYAWATAAWAAAAPMIPLYALVAAIIAVVALAALAWQNDWGGVSTFITDLWNNTLKPIFDTLVLWLQTNIPVALAALSNFWTTVLLPAIQAVATWITGTLVPVLQTIWDWLATNVPLALQTLSDFWTNTLLPAITAVWEFIQNSLVPLFTSLADVYIAAINLALTALAGLWQNVLLPAITSVWQFIQDNLVPILTSMWQWLGEKLPPALETVAGWIDTAATAIGGGLVTAITKVTGWIDTFKQKLDGLKDKLPAWLTPGSPTPMENGLVGIAAALGPVIDKLLDFAGSISGPRAKAMKDMASAFKDMSKGIDKLASSMTKISELTPVSGGGGGAGAFGGWLDQFVEVFTMAGERIQSIIDEIGYNKIKKLKNTAGRMASIINAILVDLSSIQARELPDLPTWFGQLYGVFRHAMIILNAIRDEFGNKTVEKAAELASSVGTVMQLLGVDLAAIIPPPPNFELLLGAFLAALMVAAAALLPWLAELRATFTGPVLEGASATAESLIKVVGILGLAELLASLGKDENAPAANLLTLVQTLLDGLSGAADILIPGLDAIRDRWGDALERVAEISELMQRVFGGAKDAHMAALDWVKAPEIDMGGLMNKIRNLGAATGAAVTGLTTPMVGAGAGAAGGSGGVTINLYMDGKLMQTFTEETNDAGQVDIRLAEAMALT